MLRRDFVKSALTGAAAFSASQEKTNRGELQDSCYAIVEMMGYKRLAGRLSNGPIPGLLQLDVPVEGGYITQMINPASVYRITMCDQDAVKQLAKSTDPLPAICMDDDDYQPF